MPFLELGKTPWSDDLTTAAAVKQAWAEDKEFQVHEGSGLDVPVRYGMTTKRSELAGLVPKSTSIVIRYKRQQNLTTVKL